MVERESISTNQFIWMLVSIITSFSVLQIPGFLILQTGQDAWLSVIGGWFYDVMLAIVYAYMGIRFRGENFIQYSITILGKYAGRIIAILFPLFFLIVAVSLILGLSKLINLIFLPKTPIEVIIISAYIVIGYGVRKGIEVIARNSEFMSPLFIFSIVLLCILLIPSINIDQLKPQLNDGISPFLMGSFYTGTFFGICIMMAMYIPICNKPENGFLSKFIAVTFGALVIGLIVIVSMGVFGVEQSKALYDPFLELSRMVRIGEFLERIEIIWLLISIGASILAASQLIWAASLGISQIVGLKTYKPLVYPIALLCVVLTFVTPENIIEFNNFAKYSFPILAFFIETGLEIFLFIMAFILNKKGNAP